MYHVHPSDVTRKSSTVTAVKAAGTVRWTLLQQYWRPVPKLHNMQVISRIPAVNSVEKFCRKVPYTIWVIKVGI